MTSQWDLYEYVKAAKGRPIIFKEFEEVFGGKVAMAKLKGFDDVEVELTQMYDFPDNPYGQKWGYVARYDPGGKKDE